MGDGNEAEKHCTVNEKEVSLFNLSCGSVIPLFPC